MGCKFSAFCEMILAADHQRHYIDAYKKKSIDFDGDLHVLTLILRRADSQKPMDELQRSSPTPSQQDDWKIYEKILEEDYRAQNEDPQIYAVREKLEEIEMKRRADEQQKIAVSTNPRFLDFRAFFMANGSPAGPEIP